MGITAHWIERNTETGIWSLRSEVIAFKGIAGAHTGHNLGQCKDYFAADVGHVRHRDSVVGSWSRGRARRREGRPRSAIGNEERKRETRRAQNGTQRVTGALFNCLATYTGISYILWASRRPCGTYKAGRWLCASSDSELGTRSSSQ